MTPENGGFVIPAKAGIQAPVTVIASPDLSGRGNLMRFVGRLLRSARNDRAAGIQGLVENR